MLIKCTKCGYENELGAIFCRGCGEKIDTSALDPRANGQLPDAVANAGKNKKKSKLGTVIFLIILLLLGGLVYLLLSTDGIPAYQEQTADYKLQKRMLDRNRSTAFTPAAMTAYFNAELLEKTNAGGMNFDVQNVMFQGTDDQLTAYIYTIFLTRPVVFTVQGTLTKGEGEKTVDFTVSALKVGKVNIPAQIQAHILKKFKNLLQIPAVTDVFNRAEEVEFANGALQFKFASRK